MPGSNWRPSACKADVITTTPTDQHGGQKQNYEKYFSRAWFRSTDLWVMGPARFHCATLLLAAREVLHVLQICPGSRDRKCHPPSTHDASWARGAMDNASDYGSEDSRFESWRARTAFFLPRGISLAIILQDRTQNLSCAAGIRAAQQQSKYRP